MDNQRTNNTSRSRSRRRRVGNWIALTLSATLLVSMFEQPASAAGPADWTPPAVQEVTGVRAANVKPKAAPPVWSAQHAERRGTDKVLWPTGSATADLSAAAGRARAGTLPVTVSAARSAGDALKAADPLGPRKVAVTVADRAATAKAGVAGVLVGASRADGQTGAGVVRMQVDYSGFKDAFGGDWASRLRLFQLPACAASTPQMPQCQIRTPLSTTNDANTLSVSADVSVSGGSMTMLSVEGGDSGANGDYSATTLSPAGTWQVSTQTGDFSWSYPLRMPPALGGPAPSVSLAYSSGSVDGRTATSNNQGSWIGDGWDSWPGYIERKYTSCADENPSDPSGDQCWFSDNSTLSLNGRAGELIRDGSIWRLKNDDGTKIEKLVSSDRDNGDNNNEYWKITTTDGVKYYFGLHKKSNWTSGDPVTDSTWTVPVYGDDPNDPCNDVTWCNQAWRWNLDYVEDPHGNTMMYFYGKETGAYGRDNNPNQRTTFDRGGYLKRIEYGMRAGSEYSQAAPLRVVFETKERCLANCWQGTAWTSDPNESAWDDTPWDLHCKTAPCNTQLSPTFFTARRLSKVTTQTRSGTSSYANVESWSLGHEFLEAGNAEGTPMWLRSITRTGHVTSAGGVEVSDPPITFNPGSDPLANRVDDPTDGRTALNRWRIKQIRTESGGDILVQYSAKQCTSANLPTPHTNTKRCFPSWYAPEGVEPTLDWFHKYVVDRVDLSDGVTDQPNETTFYDYLDNPAWHYTTDEITKDKHRTWSEWRGYGKVQIRHGNPTNSQQTAIEYRYLRGMHGDKQPTGTRSVTVTDSWGGTVQDHKALQGFVLQEITYNGPGGAEVSSTQNRPWINGPTATRTRNNITTEAYKTNTETARQRVALAAGGHRYTKTVTSYNADGFPTTVDDFGDEADPNDQTCTRMSYARNDTIWMIDKVSQTETLSVACGTATTPAAPNTVLNRSRTFYDSYVDGASFGLAPTKGNVVRTEELERFNGTTPVYTRTSTNTYDNNGRVLTATDPRNYTTTTAYATANGGLVVGSVVTDPKGYAVTTTSEPAWGLPTRVVDANNAVTDMTYDGLGRSTAVWMPGRNKATGQTPSMKFAYLLRNSGGPTAVTTETLLPAGGLYKKSTSLYDGWLRVRQNQSQATGGGRLVTDTFYNTLGMVAWTSQPYYDTTNTAVGTELAELGSQIPTITRTEYDGAGRETASVFVANGIEKWRTLTEYGGDRTHSTPPEGGTATTTISDARGNTVSLRQYKSRSQIKSTDPAHFDQTTYTYTPLGQIKTVTDATGLNVWSYSYDLRGRQTTSVDPDKGNTITTYDAAGNVETVDAPLGTTRAVTAYTYDALGRRTSIRNDSVTGTKRAEWTYDTVTNGLGKLASSIRYSGSDTYTNRIDTYDIYGRVTSASAVMPSTRPELCASASLAPCVYTTATTYKVNGLISKLTVPQVADLSSEQFTYGYTDIGETSTYYSNYAGAPTYVEGVIYNKVGQLEQLLLGKTTANANVAVTWNYDQFTSRLNSMNVVPQAKQEAANYNYTYDDAGNITKISDTPAGGTADHQCFTVDHLRRMTNAWTPANGSCTLPTSWSQIGGPAPYWHEWLLRPDGSRQTETRHGTTNTTYTYTHPSAGQPRPHTVTNVTASGAATWTRNYTYDNAGNTKTRPTTSGATQTLTWDREGHLESTSDSSGATSYIYDADGNRLIRTDATGKTLYLPDGTELRYTTAGATKTATRYYAHAGKTIASRTATGLHWIIGDHHGTAELTINATTLAIAQKRNLPYGEQRGTTAGTWAPGHDKGFLGKTKDPTGLTHIGAREYDPFIGRFISVDPLINHIDPQTLHGYLYSNNNPASYTDPTGESWGTFWKVAAIVAIVVVVVAVVVIAGPAIAAAASAYTAGSGLASAAGAAGVAAAEGALMTGTVSGAIGAAAGSAAVSGAAAITATGATGVAAVAATGLAVAGGTASLWYRGTPGSPIPVPKVPRTGTSQKKGGNGTVLRDGEGATPEEMAISQGGSTAHSPVSARARERALQDGRKPDGSIDCWRCGYNYPPGNEHLIHAGHTNQSRSNGGNLTRTNLACEGWACNSAARNTGSVPAGRSCAERYACGDVPSTRAIRPGTAL